MKLIKLEVGGAQVAALSELKHLSQLTLVEQRPIDLTRLGSLTDLDELHILGVPVLDFSPFAGLSRLKKLQVIAFFQFSGTAPVAHAEVLGNLISLEALTLTGLQIQNLDFAKNLRDLRELYLSHLPITSIEPLKKLGIRKMSLTDIPVTDVSTLLDLPDFTELSILRTPAREDVLRELERRGVKVNRL